MTQQHIPSTGVPSPYALAELVARRRIDWSAVQNRPALLETILQTPYEDLFDPIHGSPLYLGQVRARDGTLTRVRPEFPSETGNDVLSNDTSVAVSNLAELVAALSEQQLAEIPVRAVAPGRGARLLVELGESRAARNRRFARLFGPRLIDTLFPRIRFGYHPPGMSWKDGGRFYNEAAEFFDPVQGAVGDCYLIAALSSVAWARAFTVTDPARATGAGNDDFVHRISFFNAGVRQHVDISDKILIDDSGFVPFCRSSESGETWPALYEKAYAKMRLDEPTDFPAIPDIAGGDPVGACAQLTGLTPTYMWHNAFTAAQVLAAVKSRSRDGRTIVPMTAWTHGSGPEGDVAYRDANIVAGHAYSVLGSMRRYEFRRDRVDLRSPFEPLRIPTIIPVPDPGPLLRLADTGMTASRFIDANLLGSVAISGLIAVDYLIIRNPWGYFEGSGPSTVGASYQALDVDWWRTVPLGSNGVFAMEVNAFHRYFAGIGYAS